VLLIQAFCCFQVRDLDFAIQIVGSEVVREADGLAMSSRNVNLSEEDRKKVCLLLEVAFCFAMNFFLLCLVVCPPEVKVFFTILYNGHKIIVNFQCLI
jgi:hypothetical protein